MAKGYPIPAFPAGTDRVAFGHWLSGFVDGEGCFSLHKTRNYPSAHFSIALRVDDMPILETIRSFWGRGNIHIRKRVHTSSPQGVYYVCRVEDLAGVVIPHFEVYPLRAKKARDFAIWSEGVSLLHEIFLIPRTWLSGGRGISPKWTDEKRGLFNSLAAQLQDVRKFA